ncbi:hypothetical protein J2X49_002119 [Agrococcus sp. BE272]|nr:hypothetical protein [Agrococcus sp. BE272]
MIARSTVDEQPAPGPHGLDAAEARRRAAVLAERHRLRRRRRWTVGLAALGASALIVSGSVVAWGSQARAGILAGQITSWHEQHEQAACELEVRIVAAVALERRAEDVLTAAEHVGGAEGVLGERERSAFGEERTALLRAIVDEGFTTADDRALADRWQQRAEAAGDPAAFDLLGACVEAAAAERPPIAAVTAENVDDLDRELRSLGDPRDFDDARIDRLEAAIARLGAAAASAAESRTDIDALRSALALAPTGAKTALGDADRHIASVLAVVRGGHTPADVLDLVEGLALHVAAAWMAEAFQLEATGNPEGAALLATASQEARDAIDRAAPRPITDPGTTRPQPAPVPVEPRPVPVQPAPEPAPAPAPAPSQPAPVEPAPVEPPLEPALPDPVPPPLPDPEPAPTPPPPAPEPEPTTPAEPGPEG